ncbi:benzoate/H(+) symporter BenE family transporter [Cellulosimicrobium protaetiae]|uniref:Benzoate/H(+) symporter BenE family transporter n=1 Tax=Cellulosimicrobium protaetiae TaxID=2587808 RepID=A0A6M5UBZ8_9MICO|nr:benzoate/H(+) symporter BenE family transporter [Cellulosimicrobium protaetiae]QJW35614.1 benzoate/H(+) symporter BenE family transporter [Cellulosimicrobium protaetiae]
MDPASDRLRPVLAGLVTALVGFTSSFAVVLAGLRAVGATPDQAASGLLALCVTQAVGIFWLTTRHRTPLTLAWSTPGAALLVSTGAVAGGWPAAVGAFCVVGGLVLLTALWPRLGDLVAAIPTPIAQAMLAGVLLTLCLAPVRAVVATPLLVAPVVLVWLVLLRVAPRWAAPAALAVTLAIVGYEAVHGGTLAWSDAVPRLDLTAPTLSWQAVVGLAVPLYVVTMASQNVPGVAVMASFGYRVPWRETMTVTGLATLAGATAGGHAINLAAISAALAAGPEAHPDARRRWLAAHTAGWAYLVLAVGSAGLAALVAAAPAGLVEAAAGLALVGTLGAAVAGAVAEPRGREAAVVTFLVAASGVVVAGIAAAFWAILAGLTVHAVLTVRRRAPDPASETGTPTGTPPREVEVR